MEKKNSEAQNIAEVKADERKGWFTGTKKKRGTLEMVKVSGGTEIYPENSPLNSV